MHPFLWIGGVWTDLGVLAGYQSGNATAISNADQVAGTLDDGYGGSMAFLWTAPDRMISLGALTAGGDSQAYGVNSAGSVVGTSDGVAFLYSNSVMYDLNTLLDPSSTGGNWTRPRPLMIGVRLSARACMAMIVSSERFS